MSVFWDSGCRYVGFSGLRMSVFWDSECRFFGSPDVGFSILLFILLYIKDEKAGKMQQVFLFFQIFALFSMFSYLLLRFYTCEMVRKNPVIVVITGFRWCG